MLLTSNGTLLLERLLDGAVPQMSRAYHALLIERRVRVSRLAVTAYHSGVDLFTFAPEELDVPLFFSLALPRLSDYAWLKGENGRLPVLVNFCLDEYCNIGYMEGIALFQGRKPALLYKLAPEEFPDYGTLKSYRVADYTPEWWMKEEQAQAAKKAPVPPKSKEASEPTPKLRQKLPDPMDEPNPTKDLEYQLNAGDTGLGMVELDPAGVVGREDEDEENPPGR